MTYKSQSARDAAAMGYGDASYWQYLDEHAALMHRYFTLKGLPEQAELMFTQTLSEALQGNEAE
jgi:hypothetical protein